MLLRTSALSIGSALHFWPAAAFHPGRTARIRVLDKSFATDVIHRFISFFELQRICTCSKNIFSYPTTILSQQYRASEIGRPGRPARINTTPHIPKKKVLHNLFTLLTA